MKYLGGKFQAAGAITAILNKQPGNVYLEPFMGSCWVTAKVNIQHRIAGDLHDEVVELYHSAQNGWIPPDKLTKEEYDHIRANRNESIYPKNLMAFAAFGCAFAGSCWRKYAGEDMAAKAKKSILKKLPYLKDVRYYSSDYKELNPKGCIIYCDPPYANSHGYRITGTIGNGKFDSKEFWEIMNQWSENNLVFVSEYQAPPEFECIMEKPTRSRVRTKNGQEIRIERLFHKAGSTKAITVNELTIEQMKNIIGVPEDWCGFKTI